MPARQYKNPPIEETVCEFTWAPDQQYDLTLPGRLKMHPSMAEYSGQPRTQNVRTIAASDPSALRPMMAGKTSSPALSAFLEIISCSVVIRVGVKYVNRIVVPKAGANATEVLTEVPAQDKILEARLANYTQFAEFVRTDGIKGLVTQATLQPSAPNTTEYLLDIDTIWQRQALGNRTEIIATVEKLHDIEGAAFEALITEEARSLFDAC